jgi:hypothetical protein
MIAAESGFSYHLGHAQYLAEQGLIFHIALPQEVEGRGLDQSKASDQVRALARKAERNATAVGVANQVYRSANATSDVKYWRCFPGEVELTLASPGITLAAPPLIRRDHTEILIERSAEAIPFGTGRRGAVD